MHYSYSSVEVSRHQQGGGERAIHSLIAAVSRLHHRCRDALDAEKTQRGLVSVRCVKTQIDKHV